MREQDDVHLFLTVMRLLHQRFNRNGLVSQNPRDIGQHAGLVRNPQPQVVRGLDLAHRQDRHIRQLIMLERQVRHAVLRICGQRARDINQVGHHGRRSRFSTRPRAVIHSLADGVALDQDGVHHAFDIGNQLPGRDQRRMHAQFEAGRLAFGNAQQLDAVAQLFGVTDVLLRQLRDAFYIGLIELYRDTKADRRHDRQLVRGIDAFDVEGRIRLGIPLALGFLQNIGKRRALGAHFREDEIAGAVDDAGDPFDAVGTQSFAQRLDDRNTAADRGLEGHHHALLARGRKNLVAVQRQQGLIRGDDVFAVGNRLQHQVLGNGVATDQFDDNVDLRVIHHLKRVRSHPRRITGNGFGPRNILVRDHGDADGAARPARNFLAVTLEYLERAATDSTGAQQSHIDRFHCLPVSCFLLPVSCYFTSPSLRNISLMVRIA